MDPAPGRASCTPGRSSSRPGGSGRPGWWGSTDRTAGPDRGCPPAPAGAFLYRCRPAPASQPDTPPTDEGSSVRSNGPGETALVPSSTARQPALDHPAGIPRTVTLL